MMNIIISDIYLDLQRLLNISWSFSTDCGAKWQHTWKTDLRWNKNKNISSTLFTWFPILDSKMTLISGDFTAEKSAGVQTEQFLHTSDCRNCLWVEKCLQWFSAAVIQEFQRCSVIGRQLGGYLGQISLKNIWHIINAQTSVNVLLKPPPIK